MVADRDLLVGGSLSGDISGDGTEDSAAVHVDDSAGAGCQAFVVVTAENGVSSAPVWVLGATGGLSTPTLGSLAPIGREPGLEVIVNEAAGASTQFVGAFSLTGEGLRRMEVRGPSVSDVAGLFASGGSVGHLEAVDCLDDGVVVSAATPAAGRAALGRGIYNVVRRVFGVAGPVLEPESTHRNRVDIDDLNSRFPEFAHSPFLSCALL
ncbi:MAG: hypothetical protein ACRDJI_04570 [Actinomycetota bacterium]